MTDDVSELDERAMAQDVHEAIVAALRHEGAPPDASVREHATPAVREAYEGALVQGLCRDGAREIAADVALDEVRRLLQEAGGARR